MKRPVSTIWLVLLFIGVVCLIPRMLSAQAPARLRLGTQAPKGGNIHYALLSLSEKLRAHIAVTLYTDGVMGGEAAMIRRMRVGQLNAALLTIQGLQEIDPSVKALQEMPMMFRSLEEVEYIRQKLTPALAQRFAEKGVIVLGWGDVGWVRFFSKTSLVHPTDLKKMKLFSWAGDNSGVELLKSLGYHPVPLEINDVLTGLQTGMIDAIATVPFHALAGQVYTVAPNMLEVNWVPLVGAIVVTRTVWESLTPAVQAALRQTALETTVEIRAQSREEAARSVAAMRQRGLRVNPVPPELEAEWRRAAEEVYPKIRGTMVPAETFDEVRRLLEEYRRTKP